MAAITGMRKILKALIFIQALFLHLFILFPECKAQDVQLSQFYAAPLYLNPAFTGTSYNSRLILNYRNQWPAAGKPFITYAASFDNYFAEYNSGVGVLIMQNKEGTSRLKSTEASLLYSYHVQLNDDWTFIPALQAGYVQRSIDYSNVTFPDQFSNNGFTGATNEDLNRASKSYADFSTGGLVFSDKYWIGAAYHHLNKPNQSLIDDVNRLPGQFNFHAGARIPFMDSPKGKSTQQNYKEKAIIPSILYKSQGKFDQLDASVYLILEPVMFGIWYRGLPIKKNEGAFSNSESLISMIGYHIKNHLTIGYSYDFVISSLSMRSAGVHELSLKYEFGDKERIIKINRKTKYKRLPCPSFYRKF